MENTNFWVTLFSNPVVVGAIIGIITALLGYLAKQINSWLKLKLGKEQFEQSITIAKTIIEAVEQMAKNLGWESEQKFQVALVQLRAWALTRGIKYTDEDWKMIIEQAVFQLSNVWSDLFDTEEETEQPSETPTP